ncbi:CPBP family glutamic-type intramembrane protease [Novosphingobium sp.]|uniref:CPBP family glutamic-type intramembrane protease n=1 Tax=Novosphingobium sp. TaxID=1874826 RepID=UPI002FDD4FF2
MIRDFPDAVQPLFAFLRRPRWMQPAGLAAPGSWGLWRAATLAYLAGLVVIAGLLHLWQQAMGLPAPEAFGKVPPALLFPLVGLVAPIAEEIVFRGWLTGRPRALALLGGFVLAAAALWAVRDGAVHPLALAALLAGVLGGAAGWLTLRRRSTPAWLKRAFPVLFWVSAVIFALFHLGNYPRITPALVPMVLPQLWAGMVFGYLRMRIGVPAAMLAHALGNTAALALAFAMG